MNIVCLCGRMTRDLDVREYQNYRLGLFGICVEGDFDNQTKKPKPMFVECKVWGNQCDAIARYCKKGDQITVQGALRVDVLDDGKKICYVRVDNVGFINTAKIEKDEREQRVELNQRIERQEEELPF